MTTGRFDWTSIVARVLFSFFVVFAVYNPSGHSYWHWLIEGEAGFWSKFAVGMVLLGLHAFMLDSVRSVLKLRGTLLVLTILFGGWMALPRESALGALTASGTVVVLLTGLALLYAAGLSYSHLHSRISGIGHFEKVS
jgi:hypothetical protein